MNAPLVAVAHGSRDPRSAATIRGLLDVVRSVRPELDVRTAFLDLSAPALGDVLDAVHSDGHGSAVVVPLLLGHAYHASVDIPTAVTEAQERNPLFRVRTAEVLGPDQRLREAAWRRLLQTGADPDDERLGVVLAGAGSAHPPANRLVADVAETWQRHTAWAGAVAAFAAAADPDVPAAVERLRAAGARRFAVASWFLAPGRLPDRALERARESAPSPLLAETMGADRGIADLVLSRYDAALGAPGQQPRLSRVG
ncbi:MULTISPECIES: sirohydrochlorin chelatase [unclassified Actinopolyspora]|uniref:sirohydrochlorin chelatase n=1 Tax=unclassified Actinopolyspora TaxID=2639451 RepID=UPI0013F5CD28|nr:MULTISPECIES: sirohydrochlorin chelatase [unclassified Actinopolyspora]NHD18501.1 sirohydrochlorin chelatase [Actinopolyspora sp. BKK2]NHE77540.1 sirohydrochlorin chelatase [Actinopolyspora sp. BKK1]